MPAPTRGPFLIGMGNLPHGFIPTSTTGKKWFQRIINSDIRCYYRLIRSGVHVPESSPVGRSGMTSGELALYIIRENHHRRRRIY